MGMNCMVRNYGEVELKCYLEQKNLRIRAKECKLGEPPENPDGSNKIYSQDPLIFPPTAGQPQFHNGACRKKRSQKPCRYQRIEMLNRKP